MRQWRERSYRGLRGKRLYGVLADNQRDWIECCEANGVSYADGERGMAIREADQNELKRLETILAEYNG